MTAMRTVFMFGVFYGDEIWLVWRGRCWRVW